MHFSIYQKAAGLILLFFTSSLVSAQDSKTYLVGFSVLAEHDAEKLFMPSIGFVFERSFTKRSGIEAGIFYKANKDDFLLLYTLLEGGFVTEEIAIRANYFTLPILYRYYSKAVTLSLGPVFDAFVGWKQISTDKVALESYEVSPSFDLGPLFKVSKPISLGKNLVLEPEFRLGFMVMTTEAYYGLGIQLKERLHNRD